jgi:hypothetical protein
LSTPTTLSNPTTVAPASSRDAGFTDTHRDHPVRHVTQDAPCDGCGYNLRALPVDACCPECAAPVKQSVRPSAERATSVANQRWASLVLIGLVAMLIITPGAIWTVLEMRFGNQAFGAAPRLNMPCVKVWATPLVQRSLGSRPEWLGVYGTWLALLNLSAIFLVTSPRTLGEAPDDRPILRNLTRWLPPLLMGGYFGFLMNQEYLYYRDMDVAKYAIIGVLGCELPCTTLLLMWLAVVAERMGLVRLRKQFNWSAIATAGLLAAGVGMAVIAPELQPERSGLVVQTWSALFTAACVMLGLAITGGVVRLCVELLAVLFPRFGRATVR